MKTVILSDLHNRDYVVKDLFRKIGLMDDDGNRADGFRVIQLGDLLSLGYGEQEAEFLKWVRPFIDEQLIGNHELPALHPASFHVQFQGWEGRDVVATQMVRDEFFEAQREGNPNLWCAASSVGKWLITHAGLSICYMKKFELMDKPADEVANFLNNAFIEHFEANEPNEYDHLFLSTAQMDGSIFWTRIQYLRGGYREMHIPQIVGHTPFDDKFQPPALQNKAGNLWAIDTPGSAAALVTEDEGESFELVQSDYMMTYGPYRERGTLYHKDDPDAPRF